MQRILVVAALVSVVCGSTPASAQLPRFNPGDVLHAVDLNDIVNAIRGSATPQTIAVNCATGTIGQALQQASPGDIIQVTGTCNESVRILKDGITLDGQGTTTVDGGGPAQSTITVDGAQRVTIQGLTAQNGDRGISIRNGAAAILVDVTATGNAFNGIQVSDNATARFQGTIVSKDNGDDGILMFRGGNAFFDGATVQITGNGDAGLNFIANAHGLIRNSTFDIRNNTDDGMRVQIASAISIQDTAITLSQNGNHGLVMSGNSAITFFRGALTATNNVSDGIGIFQGAQFRITTGQTTQPGTIALRDNAGHGLNLSSAARFETGGNRPHITVTITGNTLNGVNVSEDASVRLNDSTIQNNQRTGVNLFNGAVANLDNVKILDHANGSGLNINLNSSVNANNVTVMNNANSNLDISGVGIFNASSLNLSNSTVSGNQGKHAGINLFNGASANLNTVEISGHANVFAGLWVDSGSSAFASALTVKNNGGNGVNIGGKGRLQINNSTISANQASGMFLSNGSSASLNSVTISDHPTATAMALLLTTASSVSVNNATITNNAGGGISLSNGSTLGMSNATVSNNQGAGFSGGLTLLEHCSASLSNVQISGHPNANVALFVGRSSTLTANDVTVTNNGHQGIVIDETSGFVSDKGLIVTSNSGGGMGASESRIRLSNATITGNGGTDLSASFGSSLSLFAGNTIGTLTCDSTVLSRGSLLCP